MVQDHAGKQPPPHFEQMLLKWTPDLMPPSFTLHSEDLGGVVSAPQRHTSVGGGNRSPQLSWTNPPEGTKSFAITIHDRDAPTGSGFWHWLAVNLPASVMDVPADAGNPDSRLMPDQVVQIRNDAGFAGYSGSFPPPGHGWHLYLVTVYALDTDSLPVRPDTPAAQVGFQLWQHTLEKAALVFYDQVQAK